MEVMVCDKVVAVLALVVIAGVLLGPAPVEAPSPWARQCYCDCFVNGCVMEHEGVSFNKPACVKACNTFCVQMGAPGAEDAKDKHCGLG